MIEVVSLGRGIKPDFQFLSVTDLGADWLRANRLGGLLLDMDNTLTPWNAPALPPATLVWREKLRACGVKICIVSNSRKQAKVERVAAALAAPYVYRAGKPRRGGFEAGRTILGLAPEEILVVGDQLFTDVLGGNRARMRTCLICPISPTEFIGTKILRLLERAAGRPACFQQK
ncbi:MAG: YqeG family HAD IIIA-type phosphatase [Gracilibacteraceae bacterium]|jgi:HAD superfamily phosphatase (TIGR01668 family)|nr:YqeG family HAD IIIA-type phosphatase [Gracilibacteraceae bacterium]